MPARSALIRTTLMAAIAMVMSAPEKADAFWFGYWGGYNPYYTGYAPATYTAGYAPAWGGGYAYRPLLQRRLDRLQRRSYRLSNRIGGYGVARNYYGVPMYTVGYGGTTAFGSSACCGTCGVTANYYSAGSCGCSTTCGYASSCGCGNACGDACGCGYSGYAVGTSSCPSGTCGANFTPSIVTPSTTTTPTPADTEKYDPPTDTFRTPSEPTPVEPRNPTPDRTDDLRTRPSDGFRSNTDPSRDRSPFVEPRTPSDPLPRDFNTEPLDNTMPFDDFGMPGDVELNRQPLDDALPADDESTSLPSRGRLSTVAPSLEFVRVERSRTRVSARYRLPRTVARAFDLERGTTSAGTKLAAAE